MLHGESQGIMLLTLSGGGGTVWVKRSNEGGPDMSGCAYTTELATVCSGYDRATCWVHARTGLIPPHTTVLTTQKLRLTDSDVFYTMNVFRSDDAGATWTGPSPQHGLSRRMEPDGVEVGPSDFTPAWHAARSALLGTGHTVRYRDNTLVRGAYRRQTVYSVYDQAAAE